MIGNTNTEKFNNVKYQELYNIKNIDIYKIKVIDYDGTVIDIQNLNPGQEYTLPTPPSHSGLVFQEWSSSEPINNNKIVVGNNNIIIGPIYTTASGQNEFDIELNKITGLDVILNMDGTKDWGDGTINTNTTHTYSDYGEYTIKCNGTTMNTTSNAGLFGQGTFGYISYNIYVKRIRFASISAITDSAIGRCDVLESVLLSNSVTNINARNFYYDPCIKIVIFPNGITDASVMYMGALMNVVFPYGATTISCYSNASIKRVIIPNSVTSILSGFYNCYSLCELTIPNSITSIPSYFTAECYPLSELIIPGNVTNIGYSAFSSCQSITEYDFSNCVSVPTLQNTNAFSGINQICEIKVPFNLYYDWITATNWSTYASYIISTGTVTVNFTGDNTGDIYVNNNLISGTSTTWVGSSMPYYVYDSINNIVLPTQIVTGMIENSTQNVNIDLSSKNKINLQIGVSGLDVTFTIEDKIYTATEDNGNYYIYVVGSNINVDYSITDTDHYYQSLSGTIITTGNDITETLTYNKITLSTGVSGLNVVFSISSDIYTSIEDNGNYYIYTIGSGTNINYSITDDNNHYQSINGTITTSSSDITEVFTYNKITLSTGISGLSATFIIDSFIYNSIENNGDYYMYTEGSGNSVNYNINGGDSYMDESNTITTTGSNITENITMTAATVSSWTRPNLTANGTLGENDFAVSADAYSTSASYQAWRAVDNNTTTSYYWYSKSSGTRYYTFYNPELLKVSQIVAYFNSSSYRANELYIEGSNNNSDWEYIEATYSYTTSSPYTGTLTLTNNNYYKYYRLRFVPYSTYIRMYDMRITATKKTVAA